MHMHHRLENLSKAAVDSVSWINLKFTMCSKRTTVFLAE